MPNNIMLSFPTIFCKGRIEADIETVNYEGTDKDGYPVKITQVQCTHEHVCKRIEKISKLKSLHQVKEV